MQQNFNMQAFTALLSKIQKKDYSPFYLLSGNEPFFIDTICNVLIENLLEESSKDFDFSQFYGKEALASDIIETAKRFPMLSKYNLVIVKEAQFMNASEFDLLASYASQPMLQTVVVFCFKNKAFDKRKKLFKAVEKTGEVLTVKPLYENQLKPWIKNQAKNRKLEISPVIIELFATYIGADLTRIDNELKKLKSIIPEGELITQEHIEKHIGISKSFNNFELQKAIGLGSFSKAFQIIQYLNRNPKENPMGLTLATLHTYFQKLLLLKSIGSNSKSLGINPYFMKDYQNAAQRFSMKQLAKAMEYVLKSDLKSKGIEAGKKSTKDIMEELLLKLFSL